MPLCNAARGEVVAALRGRDVRLCVTLRALTELEAYFRVSGFEALGGRLKSVSATDLRVVLQALVIDGTDLDALDIALPEAVGAVVSAFTAMTA